MKAADGEAETQAKTQAKAGASADDALKGGYAVGQRVTIQSLKKASAKYNETGGTLMQWSAEHQRWKVSLDLDGATVVLKLDNFRPAVAAGPGGG